MVALWEDTSPPKPSPSPDPFGDSDAEAFIDQLLSDGHLETPAKSCAQRWGTHQPALDTRTMDNIAMDKKMEGGCTHDWGTHQPALDTRTMDKKMEGGCTHDWATHQPALKTDDMIADRRTVEGTGEWHFMVSKCGACTLVSFPDHISW